MDFSEAVRQRIIELCTENNMNVNQLSISSDIDTSTIPSILESRFWVLNSQTVSYLCISFDISLMYFYNSKLFENLADN